MMKSADSQHRQAGDPKLWWCRTRMHVALLGLAIAAVNCYAQATFCIAIVEMVLPADYVTLDTHAQVETKPTRATNQTHALPSLDHSCPIELRYRDYYESWRFPASTRPTTSAANESVVASASNESVIDVSNRFDWDASQQGLLLGAFAVGTAPLQVIGGRLAEIYGSKWVLLAGCLGTALTNLTIPHLAHFSFLLLLANRILMGVAQAGMEPGLMCLLADWLTPSEAGFFISMLLFAICVGFFLGSLCSSFILALGYGWPLTYYVAGGLNLCVGLVWFLYADSWPHASNFIKQPELAHIKRQQQAARDLNNNNNRNANVISNIDNIEHDTLTSIKTTALGVPSVDSAPAPWRNILTTRSVWAFIICKISVRWCADVLSNELPTYLANVLHLSIKINGLLNSISTALFALSSFVTGYLANELFNALTTGSHQEGPESARLLSTKTHLRKAFQSVASFGSALCIILMVRYDCDIALSMSMMLALSCCLVMGTGGELQIPYDMTTRYPGTLHGMACTLSVSGWLAPPLIGLVLGDQPSSRARWSIVWHSTAAINLIGGLVFVLFADASPQDFDKSPAERTLSSQQEQLSKLEDESRVGYVNSALSNSSAENSPKSSHAIYSLNPNTTCTTNTSTTTTNTTTNTNNNNDYEHAAQSKSRPSLATFDSNQLMKMRQLESSFIHPGALGGCPLRRDLDSPLSLDGQSVILPYREHNSTKR